MLKLNLQKPETNEETISLRAVVMIPIIQYNSLIVCFARQNPYTFRTSSIIQGVHVSYFEK